MRSENLNLEEARQAIGRADFPGAIRILSEIAVDDAGNAEVWRELGVCYLETRRHDLALEALTRAVKIAPADPTAQFLLGHAYGSSGQLEPAAACYRRVLETDPGHVKAEEFLIRTESLLESREHYRNGLKWLYQPGPSAEDLNRAVRDLVQSIAIFDGSPARDNLLECARKLLELRREWPVPGPGAAESGPWGRACERGYYCISFKNWVGAREAYEEALALRTQDAFVHHVLGFCFVELGEIEETVRAWLRVVELDPQYDFTYFGRPRKER
ncbi:MAG TPA: tetratricopeptide repeat protein [Terriglobia bacterium]|nr:tetratricopeptide repeat protein [Terriglobia bacterium]